MEAAFIGKEVAVTILQVDRSSRKVVCSLLRAVENDSLRHIEVHSGLPLRRWPVRPAAQTRICGMDCCVQVGALVRGKVRRVESFGAFVGIEGTRTSGLLHISNVSRQHVQDLTVSPTASMGRPALAGNCG
jgi:predicted RNA-binding protein with RPS1 domain